MFGGGRSECSQTVVRTRRVLFQRFLRHIKKKELSAHKMASRTILKAIVSSSSVGAIARHIASNLQSVGGMCYELILYECVNGKTLL